MRIKAVKLKKVIGSAIKNLCVIYSVFIQIYAISSSSALDLEHHIRKRSLREDGYTNFQLVSLSFTYKHGEVLHSFTNSRHARDTREQNSPVEMHIDGGDEAQFEILLEYAKPVFSKNIEIVVVSKDSRYNTGEVEQRDCFMSGTLKSKPGSTAVISFCNGLIGAFTNGTHHYFLEATDDEEDNTVILARKKMRNLQNDYDQVFSGRVKPIVTSMSGRQKRSLGSLVIETVVILDQDYVANLRAAGHDTNQSISDLMRLKFTGVQAEWGKVDVLDYGVTIEIKKIEIWENNPSWYTPSTILDDTLYEICHDGNQAGLWTDYDHVHLFTGKPGTDVSGKAYTGKMCVDGSKCAVSTNTSIAEYYIPAHEIGHSLGLPHDGDIPYCTVGIMGGTTIGWSNCSVSIFKNFVANLSPNCLQTNDVSDEKLFTLEAVWPGMTFTDDEICELQNGPGFVYKGSMNTCSGYSCINLDPSSEKYGVSFRHTAPTDGRYCGEDMVCTTDGANYRCINVTDTGLDPSLITKVPGGWSGWGSFTSCSRTCGTGVQYRHRTCDNPKPKNSPTCEGGEYDAQLCSKQPCSEDSTDQDVLITQRAGETCVSSKANDLYSFLGKNSANYLTVGSKYSNSDDNQCDVKCDTVQGYSAAQSERHGIMPDGTPCSLSSLSSFVETNNLPRKSGLYGTCVQGHCYQFGCDDNSGNTVYDGCGVCGGDNSTCQIVEGVYDTVLDPKARGLIVRLPANASMIQIYFTYGSMAQHFLELKMKDTGTSEFGTNVISYTALDTTANPISFAGTYWYLLWSKQYLYAQGPIDQAADVVLFNFNGGVSNPNTGVTYSYSVPLDMASCSGTCENGGTWNSSTCSCDCANGYYGISCNSTCKKYCKNSQPLSASGCSCDCQGNTYGTACNCKYPFTGIDCQDCKITSCQNNGTFNATACRCDCPQGYGSLDCSSPCEDTLPTEDCLVKVGNGQCETHNENMELKCYKSCGLCEPFDTTTAAPTTTQSSSEGTSAENCTESNTDDCNSGAGSLLLQWSYGMISLPVLTLISSSLWLLLTLKFI